MINAKEARKLATNVLNEARKVQFLEFAKELETNTKAGNTEFFVNSKIDLIMEDLKELGYTFQMKETGYNETSLLVRY